jgi:Tfp pilus assembly protein PilN
VMQQINLYRPIFRKQEKKFSAVAMAQAGTALLLGIAGIYGIFAWQLGFARSDLRQAEKRHADVSAQLQSVTERFGGRVAQGQSEAETLEKEIAARRQILQAMSHGSLGNNNGYSEYFMALARQRVDGVWITNVAISGAGEEITLKGRAIDGVRVPQLVQRLSNERALAGKQFELFMMTNEGKDGPLGFTLQTTNAGAATGGRP